MEGTEKSSHGDTVTQRKFDLCVSVALWLIRLRVLQYLCVVAGCVAVLGRATPVIASVDDYLGKTIGSVHILIEGRETVDPVLIQVVETTAGQPLSMVQVRESIAHLFSLARFETARVDATLENGRVALRYELSPIHPVTAIRFTGADAPGIDAGALRRAIVDRYGGSPPLARAADMARIIADALRERGYLHAAITPRAATEHVPERAILTFAIDPGPRTTIGSVDLIGRATVSRVQLLGRLGLRAGAPYERDALNGRIERYVEERRAAGYYEAKIAAAVRLTDDDRVAHIALTITPGPRVRVVFAGDPLPSDRRDELVPVQREGTVDEDLLEDSSNRIEDVLRAQGYRDAVAPHTRAEVDGELVITFTVKRGQQYLVSAYEISGNASVPLADFAASLRLAQGQPFSSGKLDTDVSTIEELYHRRGFASARAVSEIEVVTATPAPAQIPVIARVVVNEGVRTTVDGVVFAGNDAVNESTLRSAIGLQPGAPFVPGQVAVDRDAIQLAYQNLGYESATVDAALQFTDNNTHVTVRFAVREGPQIFVDHVLIVGNVRTSTATIERELQLKPGAPFSLSAINDSQRRLTTLGLFRRARITELRHGDESRRDLLVTIEEAPPTTVGYGGGVEGRLLVVADEEGGPATEQFDIAPRAFFQIGRRNLFGSNRSASLFTSVSLHSKHSSAAGVTEYRAVGTFREPRLFNSVADAFVNVTLEQQIRSSFNFTRRSASAVIARHLTRDVSATGNYQIQSTSVFDLGVAPDLFPLIDRTFTQFLLSSFSASVIRDTRDDPVDPASGDYMSGNGQIAARAIGSEVGFMKSFVTAQLFRALPTASRIVLAGSARLGMATGFTTLEQLPASERFFAGGDTTVRGFALDRLGVRHVPSQPGDTVDSEGLPIGGNGLVIFNAELRAGVGGGSQLVGFFDAGNVFARAAEIDLGELRSAVGGGVRYKSPFGPIRFDLGFKVRRQPGEGLTAWFVSFGQAF
jgi:outer membrane protein insertion porin family